MPFQGINAGYSSVIARARLILNPSKPRRDLRVRAGGKETRVEVLVKMVHISARFFLSFCARRVG